MNTVIFSGKLFSEPQRKPVRETHVVNFGILNEEGKKSQLIGCEAWGPAGNQVMNMSKGDDITVRGVLNQNSWTDKEGATKSIVRIRVDQVSDIVFKASPEPTAAPTPAPAPAPAPAPVVETTEEIPF